MTKSKLIFQTILSILIIVTLASCRGSYITSLSKDATVIPQDLEPQKHILLVEHISFSGKPDKRLKSKTNKLRKVLRKYYTYRYEIASANEILNNPKYADTSLYRFAVFNSVFSRSMSTTTTTTSSTGGTYSVSPSARVSSIDFYFYDRSLNKEYEQSGFPSSFLKTTFSIFMGAVRKNLKHNNKY